MKRFSTNLVFVDLLFNLLVGFTSLFIIAFMLINPIAKQGIIDPPVLMLVEARWNDHSSSDIDLYVRGPTNQIVYYGNLDGAYIILERDDLGAANDEFEINGEKVTVVRNYEITTLTMLPPGEYVVNIHNFTQNSMAKPEEVEVVITTTQPYDKILSRKITVPRRTERTIATFMVDTEGKVYDLRTDIEVSLRTAAMPGTGRNGP